MAQPSKQQYLETKVRTASQPQLHTMLLNGALQFGRQAKEAWEESEASATADQFLIRMMNVVEELTLGAAAGTEESSPQLEEQYAFIYRELTACRINRQLEKLDSCLQLLEYQQETWKLATEMLSAEESTSRPDAKLPGMHIPVPTAGGLSLEA